MSFVSGFCRRFIRSMLVAGLIVLTFNGPVAWAGPADVLAVQVQSRGDRHDFSVTIRSADTGWDYYCDRFELVGPDGTVIGTRILAHPHVDEQPFTRSLSGVSVPAGIASVLVRARMKPDGAGGETVSVPWPPSGR